MHQSIFHKAAICVFLWLSLCGFTKNGIVYTTDGSRADVAAAVADASRHDQITLPAGSFNWAGRSVTIAKEILIQGAGMTSTIIQSNACPVFTINSTRASGCRITTLKIDVSASPARNTGVIEITNGPTDWRIDHVYFLCNLLGGPASQRFINAQLYAEDKTPIQGLVDNCRIDNGKIFLAQSYTQCADLARWNCPVWSTSHDFGGDSFVVVEDCEFYNFLPSQQRHVVDGNCGPGIVFRYNKVYGFYLEFHGPEWPVGNRGFKKWELYRNLLNGGDGVTYGAIWRPVQIRAGTGRIFQNTLERYTQQLWYFNYYRWTQDRGVLGTCNGGNDLDANIQVNGSPCMDAPGSGPDAAARTYANRLNPSVDQPLSPVYIWGNTVNTVACTSAANTWNFDAHFQPGREVIVQGYGSPTMTSGTLSAKPGICTEGEAYWATDQGSWNQVATGPWGKQQGVLYTCGASSNWTLAYTPLTYPHPLRTDHPRRVREPNPAK